MSDQEMIIALSNGDSNAFRNLVSQHQDMVVRTAYAYLKNIEEAEDLAQEVFISVFENISKFRGDANLKTWIYRITINKSINTLRKQKLKTIFSLNILSSSSTDQFIDSNSPDQVLQDKQYEENLNRAMSKLSENQRTAFILHKYDDLPQQEIAEIMGLSVSAVESLIYRAKIALQEHLLKKT